MLGNGRILMVAVLACALGACSSGSSSSQASGAAAAPQTHPKAQKSLKLYRGLLAKHEYALAAPIGSGTVKRYPDSAAAKEINRTLADTQKRADAINDARRLKALWLYQSGTQSGGQQNTASIDPSKPSSAHGRIQLVLRRHSDWGQSVYLYDHGGNGFVCQDKCRLSVSWDDKPAKKIAAFLPETSDPAIFIEHDKRFLARMEKAKTVTIDVRMKDGSTPSLEFEVSGFDPDKWPSAGK